MTDQREGKSPELGRRSRLCYLRHFHRLTVGSLLFQPAERGGEAFSLHPPTPILRAVLLETGTYFSYTLEFVRWAGEALPYKAYKVKDRLFVLF